MEVKLSLNEKEVKQLQLLLNVIGVQYCLHADSFLLGIGVLRSDIFRACWMPLLGRPRS